VKKLCFIAICVAFLLSSPLTGQTTLGFKGGLSLSTIGGSDAGSFDAEYRSGFGLGAFMAFALSDRLSVQPEISYLQKGLKSSESGVDFTFALDYLEIPVLLRVDIPVEGTIAPYFVVGPALSFKAGCEISGSDSGTEVTFDCDEAEMEVKALDFGGIVGVGLSVEAGPGDFLVQGRYNFGFTTLDDSEYEDDIKSRAFFFGVGYSFPIGG
jgi:hypothetical protein